MRKSYEAQAKEKAKKLGFTIEEDEFGVDLLLPSGYNGKSYHSVPYPFEQFGTRAELWLTLRDDIDAEDKYKNKCTPNTCDCWDEEKNRCDYLIGDLYDKVWL